MWQLYNGSFVVFTNNGTIMNRSDGKSGWSLKKMIKRKELVLEAVATTIG
jgi:hypothetical protein